MVSKWSKAAAVFNYLRTKKNVSTDRPLKAES